MHNINILIVDDSSIYRKILTELLQQIKLVKNIHTAVNGYEAVEKVKKNFYDIIILDSYMPEINGLETLKLIKQISSDSDVIMLSNGETEKELNNKLILETLEYGAFDFIIKPKSVENFHDVERLKGYLFTLIAQIQIKKSSIYSQKKSDESANNHQRIIYPRKNMPDFNHIDLLVLAASTGGPAALEKVFSEFIKNFNVPVFLVQHMPQGFTKTFADSIRKNYNLNINEAADGEEITGGKIYLAPGGKHLQVKNEKGKYFCELSDSKPVNSVKPAADVLFSSIAMNYKRKNILAVVLTGMGKDGTKGIEELKNECNCYCICQSEKTSVVYGMPKSIVDSGLCDQILDIENIGPRISNLIQM